MGYERKVINPGGQPFGLDDVDGYIAQQRREGIEPYVDLGGIVVPLAEVADTCTGEE